MSDAPRGPSDPRPNGEPYYIDSTCRDCGEELILFDDEPPVWHDEWWCPECDDGLHMDWPAEYGEAIFGRVDEIDFDLLEEADSFDPERDNGRSE